MEKSIVTKNINVAALAYIGDGIYEICIREHILKNINQNVDIMHKEAVKYVSANGQCTAVKAMIDEFLTEDEVSLVKRARNHKIVSKAKNATPIAYKWATGFEALIGYLYLEKNEERMREIINKAIEILNV